MIMIQSIAIIFALVVVASLLSGAEVAFAFSNRLRVELEKNEDLSGRVFSFFFSHLYDFPVILRLLSLLNAFVLIYLVASFSSGLNVSFSLAACLVFAIVLVFVYDLVLRAIGYVGATSFFSILAYPLFLLYWVAYPFEKLSVCMMSLFKGDKSSHSICSINRIVRSEGSDIKQTDDAQSQYGDEVKLFQNALDFSKIRLKDSLVPRTEICAVDIDTPIPELCKLFAQTHYSRIIVYKDSIDNVMGYVHSADMFDNPDKIESILNPIIIVPEMMTANKLLRVFLKKKKSLALVVDEFGGTSGIVTIEDVMEEIFGEIEDEHDDDSEDGIFAKKVDDKTYVISGRLEVDVINDKFGLGLPLSDNYVTIGGMILDSYGFLPDVNDEVVVGKCFHFRIIRTTSARVDLVKLFVKSDVNPS